MQVTVSLDDRFVRTPDGQVWTVRNHPYAFWQRYLSVFDSVTVAARVKVAASVDGLWSRADGESVTFAGLPHFIGPWQYLCHRHTLGCSFREITARAEAIILRGQSHISDGLFGRLPPGRPYAVEVINDPWDAYSPGTVTTALRPYLRRRFTRILKRQCARAAAVSYVTRHALQRRYPAAPGAFTASYSSVHLEEDIFGRAPAPRPPRKPVRLVTVTNLDHLNKGTDTLVEALADCVAQHCDLTLTIVGDGKFRRFLASAAERLGVGNRVLFTGEVAGPAAVREYLHGADLFVLPSRHEGLPRAMIEAMAAGLPCIGSTTGGIPELLPPEDLTPPNARAALADKIRQVVTSPVRLAFPNVRNVEVAQHYRTSILQARRIEFYRHVAAVSKDWM
jgi:glycosyltransferase involved in cell wall biosynthesis